MKRVALLGCGAAIPDYKTDVWGLNACFLSKGDPYDISRFLLQCTAWFELHRRSWLRKHFGAVYLRVQEHALKNVRGPVYVSEPWPKLPNARLYPKARIERLVPHGRYHTMSFSWMVALALHLGYKEINLHGVDLGPMDAGEPVSGRPCVEYWCGVAEGRGAKVVTHPPTTMFTTLRYLRSDRQYGFDPHPNVQDE